MKKLTCEMCGSTDMLKEDGVFVCQSCGTKYSVEEAKKLMIEGTVEVQGTVAVDKAKEAEALLKRAFMFLGDSDWGSANSYCDKVLDIDPENSEAYLGKLMAEVHATPNLLYPFTHTPIEDNSNYKKMLKFANEKVAAINQEILECQNEILIQGNILSWAGCRVTDVSIPDNITMIADMAFENCTKLTNVTIPTSVTYIGSYAFKNCSSLHEIVIPDSVTSLGSEAFEDCTSLTNVTLSNNIECLYEVFKGCDSLKNVTLPDNPDNIVRYDNTFEGCTALETITVPTGILKGAFTGCYGLREVVLTEDVSIGDKAFFDCDHLTQITIPRSERFIGNKVFAGCSKLESVTILNSETAILRDAFDDCYSLRRIEVPLDYKIDNCYSPEARKLIVRKNLSHITLSNNKSSENSSSDSSSIIPLGTTIIEDDAFHGWDNITDLIIPDGVTSIGNSAFQNCTNLTSVTIPNSVISIGHCAFMYCSSLANIVIPDSVTTLGQHAFADCSSLTNIVISNSVTSIEYLCCDCTNLMSITLPENLETIGNCTFQNCTSLTNIDIPNSVTCISDYAFRGCRNLTNLTISKNVTHIGSEAFRECSSLTSVTIPDSVKSIGRGAFKTCTNLTSVTMPRGITFADTSAFADCGKCTVNYSNSTSSEKSGCYVATCVYGSYDCPQVWTLRRFRDDTLGATWYGRLFIRTYYAISPTLVKWFGKTNWFKKLWRGKLDRMVAKLQNKGVEDTPYQDKEW